jgi:hypothetical protein
MGPLTEQQLETILKTVIAERERGELLQRQQEMIGNYLDATRSVRGEIEAILSGTGKLSNLPQIFRNLQGKELAEKLFGPMFRELDRWVQDESGMKDATSAYISSTKTTGEAALELADQGGPRGQRPDPRQPARPVRQRDRSRHWQPCSASCENRLETELASRCHNRRVHAPRHHRHRRRADPSAEWCAGDAVLQ